MSSCCFNNPDYSQQEVLDVATPGLTQNIVGLYSQE